MTTGGMSGVTPSQTIGPFFALPDGMIWTDGPDVVSEDTPGAVVVHGTLFDGAGDPVPDGLVETWQADEHGRYPDAPRGQSSAFGGFGRCGTDGDGRFWFRTVKPGAAPAADGAAQAPHLDVTVFARGLLKHVVTRLYFPEDGEAHAKDPVLSAVEQERRSTLVAVPDGDRLRFDIHLQGERETVFFAL